MDPRKEWGLPEWQDDTSYGDTAGWGFMRWRWEFSRRREDLRAAFDARAEQTYKDNISAYSDPSFVKIFGPGRVLRPDERGFVAQGYLEDNFGYMGIPNPRISDQSADAIFSVRDYPGGQCSFDDWTQGHGLRDRLQDTGKDILIEMICGGPENAEFVVTAHFDISKPLAEQLEAAKHHLEGTQLRHFGRKIQKRRHPDKYLTYLRVLDARECGASWAEIAQILMHTAGTEQAARDAWNQARALCFNF